MQVKLDLLSEGCKGGGVKTQITSSQNEVNELGLFLDYIQCNNVVGNFSD